MSAGDVKAACGCCEGTGGAVPVDLTNRPGLSALAYRAGTHARFKEEMLAAISALPALKALTTRHDDDPTLALLDAWATSLDVLTFYQERIANEGFLRTAVERRSLLELARTIGYELRPGVAASTWLAFTLDGNPGSPREVTIPAGTRAQSLPTKSELPQSFETGEALLARPEWNALRPQQTETQEIAGTEILLEGLATQLRPGDALLFLGKNPQTKDPESWDFHLLTEVEPRTEAGVTRVAWHSPLTVAADPVPRIFALRQRAAFFGANAPDWKAMTPEFRIAYANLFTPPLDPTKKEWPDMPTSGLVSEIDLDATYPRIAPESWFVLVAPKEAGIFKLGDVATVSRAGFSLSARVTRLLLELSLDPTQNKVDLASFGVRQTAVYAESERLTPAQQPIIDPITGKEIPLDQRVNGLARGRSILVQGRRMRGKVGPAPTDSDAEPITLKTQDGSMVILEPGESVVVVSAPAPDAFKGIWRLRRDDGVEGFVELWRFTVRWPGDEPSFAGGEQTFTLEPAKKGDPEAAEVAFLEDAIPDLERTTLKLTEPLANLYDRTSVRILANVAPATHGETKHEVLGAGDAAKRFQRFRLRQKPLTYTAAAVPEGGESTLELRVNGVLWHESPDLYRLGPKDRQYVLRRDDEGNTTVLFGDGTHGARLPSGSENVEAVYRAGIGLPGLVGEDRISLLTTRPLGVKSVTNPIPATGAADPQTRDQARRNAPMTVLTLDRVVSLLDFEDFARSFSGIGKAQARMLWDQGRRLVHLTVAGIGGSAVAKGSELMKKLRAALDGFRDPFQELVIDSYDQLLFLAGLKVKVNPDYVEETVLRQVEAALRSAFSFEARDFGQSVFLSEVMAVAQGVEGVVYVDVDSLRVGSEADTVLHDRIDAHPARIDEQLKVRRAEILLLSPQSMAPKAIHS